MTDISLDRLADKLAENASAPGTALEFTARDLAQTDEIGRALAVVLPPGTVVALDGTLGAGKTRLVEAVAAAMGVPRDEITSPTFVLIQEYRSGRVPIFHFDAYRLRDEDEFAELGPEEYFDGAGISFVEWADRVAGCLPKHHWRIEITHLDTTARRFRLEIL